MAVFYKQYTITASAVSLTTAMGLAQKTWLKEVDIIGKTGSMVGEGFIGGSNVTNVPANAGGKFTASLGYTMGPLPETHVNTDDVFIVGTAADIAHITMVT